MKKTKFFHLVAAAPTTPKSSNWKFGWSPSSIDTQIEDRRSVPRRTSSTLGGYGVTSSKPSSGW